MTRLTLMAAAVLLMMGNALAQETAAEQFARGLEAYDGGRYEDAAIHWGTAAEHGHIDAITSLASMLLHGEGVDENPTRARALYRAAAERGDTTAMIALGEIASQPKVAYVWFGLAAAAGHAWAAAQLPRLASDLSASERNAANRTIRNGALPPR